jgi:hypothetical protein
MLLLPRQGGKEIRELGVLRAPLAPVGGAAGAPEKDELAEDKRPGPWRINVEN